MQTRSWHGTAAGTYLFLAALAVFLSGCASLGQRFEAPRVTLAGISVEKIGLLEQVLRVELRLVNANEIPFQINGLDCSLMLNGEKLASGVSHQPTPVPALGTAVVPVQLYTSLPDIVKSLLSLREEKSLTYKITGRLHVEGGFLMPPVLPFSAEGTLSKFEDMEGRK